MQSARLAAIASIAIATATAVAATLAQQPELTPQFRTGVDVLQLDVSVLDGDRKPITGLTQTDFSVEVDGKPAQIIAFTSVTIPSVALPPAAWMREVAPDVVTNEIADQGRTIVIMFDQSFLPEDTPAARKIAHAVVDGMGPTDVAAVIYIGRAVPQNFTMDRGLLHAAVDQTFLPGDDDNPGRCLCGMCKLEAITHVADALKAVPRRKALFFIGTSIPLQARPPTRTTSANGPIIDCSSRLKPPREKMFRALDNTNLVMHWLDPQGLGRTAPAKTCCFIVSDDPRVITDRTGGRAVRWTNAPDLHVPAILAESGSYYVLGIERPAPRARNRDSDVRVTVGRRDAYVSAPRAYGPIPERLLADTPLPDAPPRRLVDALATVWPTRTIPMSVTAAAFDSGGDAAAVVVVADVRRSATAPGNAPPSPRTVSFLAGSWDPNGRPIATQNFDLELPRTDHTGGLGTRYELAARLNLASGRREIRVSVEDHSTQQQGSVYTHVDVPDFAKEKVSLSGLLAGAAPAPPLASADLLKDLLPIVPTALREFTRTSRVAAFVRAYQGGDDSPRDVTMTATLLGVGETPIHRESTTLAAARFTRTRSTDYLIEVPVAQLAPGPYLLTLEAALDDKRVARHMRFEMR
jgi:VWFA-related protein